MPVLLDAMVNRKLRMAARVLRERAELIERRSELYKPHLNPEEALKIADAAHKLREAVEVLEVEMGAQDCKGERS
jgi:hypothetical protein